MESTIGADYAYNLIYQIVRIVAPVFTAPYIARVIGAEGVGAFAFTYSVADYFGLFAMLGIKNYGNRSIAAVYKSRNESSRVFWNIYAVQIATSLFACLVYIIYGTTVRDETKAITCLQFFFVVSAFFDIDWFFYGMHQFRLIAMRSTVVKIISILLIFLFVKKSGDLPLYTIIMAGGVLLSSIALWPAALKQIDFLNPDLNRIRENIKPILALFVPVIAVSVYRLMDKIMLGVMTDMAQVGYYENAEKIISVSNGVIVAFGTVMLPRMSYLAASGETRKTEEYIQKSMEGILFIVSLLAFGIIGVAPHFTSVFYGDEFLACAPLMTGLAVTLPIMGFANVIRTQYLIPMKKDGVYILSGLIGAVLNLVLNLLLLPRYGAIGAVVSTVLTEFVVAFVQSFMVRKELALARYVKNGVFPLGAGGVMCFILRQFCERVTASPLMLAVEIFLGVFIFFVLSFVYALVNKESMLSSMIRKGKNRVHGI